MLNQGNDVPENTIVYFDNPETQFINFDRVNTLFQKNTRKREWFSPRFYRCLPLMIGNQYGFSLVTEHDFEFSWDGEDSSESLKIKLSNEYHKNKLLPTIYSHFGHGIMTVNVPIQLRTPKEVNLVTINPPNYVVPNITVMTGVIESDNLRRGFSFNLKVQQPGITTIIKKGTPIAAFIPVPRYFSDSFEIKNAEDIFSEDVIIEEINASVDASIHREVMEEILPNNVGKLYNDGIDVYGNKFPDHQKK